MADYNYLSVSDGTGDASIMHVTGARAVGVLNIAVDSTVGVPTNFIGTQGTLLSTGFVDPTTICNFKGHTSGSTGLVIDAFEPGSSDTGSASGQVIIIKPNTGWANRVASFIKNATGFGTPEAVTFGAATATSLATTANVTVGGNITLSGTAAPSTASVTTGTTITPTKQVYNVTALASAATVNVPSFTASDGMAAIVRIKDNGTSQTLTFAAGWGNVSGVSTPTATTAGKQLTVGALYNSATSAWEIQGINIGA